MTRTTAATVQLLMVAVVSAAILLLGASADDDMLGLAILRLLNTWLRHTGTARARRRSKWCDNQETT